MNRHQLDEELRAAGVPAARYEIADRPGGPWPTDRLYLEEAGGGWVVGVQERGVRRILERFPDEDRACRGLYALLTYHWPPPAPLTSEETRELLDGEGVRRRAQERLARALESARRPPRDEPGD
ncbi:hypothetical protein [Streptomyces sp. NBC_01190]|uniref:hypothetical protein n=1 Tax=Streptomyces sp. NBC_01190 TaxID=2903767 RepID=UPI00386AA1F0|nr:hypothetical protein OG519_16655 [Streptomyces sp. NBC_01190]